MIIKKEYRKNNTIQYTMIDNIDKVDVGTLDSGKNFINIYFKGNKQDEFETLVLDGITVYLMNNTGKTLAIYK